MSHEIALAMRNVAARIADEITHRGGAWRLTADDLAETLLSIADQLDPPVAPVAPVVLRSLLAVGQLRNVEDLQEGQRSFPERWLVFRIESEDAPSLNTTVAYVERRGDCLFARGHNGQDYAITGVGAYTLKKTRLGR